jgi:3-hydroxyisobutyrate dehydrogenase-like beta-hydroxyacid dehydrogenase
MKVGFIGLGRMGAGMAANLVTAGHEVTVYNRTPSKLQALVERGAHAAARVADACQSDAVVTMLADDSAVEGVVFGDEGVIGSLRKGAIHISMSTISVALSKRLVAAHADAAQRLVAAPVFGRPEAAAAVIEALGEAMALVGKAGVDRHRYVDLLTSTIFPAPVYKTYGELIADRRFEPAAFAAPLGHKDIRLTLGAAEALRVPMPFANVLHDRFLTLLAHGGDALDWSAIGELAAKDSGQATAR